MPARSDEVTWDRPTEAWVETLEAAVDLLRSSHPGPFRLRNRDSFNRLVRAARRRVRDASGHAALLEIVRIVAAVKDGHTQVPLATVSQADELPYDVPWNDLPWNRRLAGTDVELRWFPDGIYVTGAGEFGRHVVGGRVERIGTATVNRAFELVSSLVSGENEWRARAEAPGLLTLPDVVCGLGLHPSNVEIPLVVDLDGVVTEVVFPATAEPSPAHLLAGSSTMRWSTVNAEFRELVGAVMYLKYDRCRDQPDRVLRQVFSDMFDEIRREPHRALVVDLRHNGGGDNRLNWPLVYEIIRTDAINRPGCLFALIGRDTFSAAMNCVVALERHTAVTFVGEPTGASPNHFGDAWPRLLPATDIEIDISTLWWQESLPYDHRLAVRPHIPVQLMMRDFKDESDVALDAAVSSATL